ncbi:MAG TPA: hypothetical protein VL049_15510, partial [Candidatus Dormibacteraeota bacterium]|nr:hypothetical protein [Candidatus Dormibacteraeota bacterium]
MRIALRVLIFGALLFVLFPLPQGEGQGEGIPTMEEAQFARAAEGMGFSKNDPVIARRLIRNAQFLRAADDTAALREADALHL